MKLTRQAGICATLMGLGWQSSTLAGDKLLIHGHIYTGNPQAPWADFRDTGLRQQEAVRI